MTEDEPPTTLIELLPCKICGKEPHMGGVLFMGNHVECTSCGIAFPFPPVMTAYEAAVAWNENNEKES